jgi:glycosyltransferase involved in cell wall biosynthesis
MDKIPISVVVLTHNEEDKIKDCLDSVKGWVEEIIIVDDRSTDKTIDIVKDYTPKIFERKWEMEGKQRNFAYSQASCDYILSLDADERIMPELRDEIIEIFGKGPKYEGYNIRHRNFIGNFWIRHGEWYPNSKLKIFKKTAFKYEEAEYHPRAIFKGKTKNLTGGDILHYNFRDFHDIFAKLNHQTDFEAKKWIREGRKLNRMKIWRKMFSRFMKYYLQKKGFLDGYIGFFMARYSGMYQYWTYLKYRAIKTGMVEDRS